MATPKQQEKVSLAWFQGMLKSSRGSSADRQRVGIEYFSSSEHAFLGGMFFFLYDAKHKDKLEYWDRFPLVIPIGLDGDSFLGLNLHYLPPVLRKQLLDKLLMYRKRANSANAYMKLSYPLLTSVVKTELFSPCVHRYLYSHVRSKFVKVAPEAWENATMLPVQRFVGATSRQVWGKKK